MGRFSEKEVNSIQSECATDSIAIAVKGSVLGTCVEEKGHSSGEKVDMEDSPVLAPEFGDKNVAGKKCKSGSEQDSSGTVVLKADCGPSIADVKYGEADQDQLMSFCRNRGC